MTTTTTSTKQQPSLPFDLKLVTVLHHTKHQGKSSFPLRVLGHRGEAFTVHKSYEQYLDLSHRLAADLPHLVNQNRLPRLSTKLALFFTRPSLATRQEDLDNWVRCLAEMPQVRAHPAFIHFLLHQDPTAVVSSSSRRPTLPPSRPSLSPSSSPLRADFLTKELPPTPAAPAAAHRPALAHKRSTPNLRTRSTNVFDPDLAPAVPPPMPVPAAHHHHPLAVPMPSLPSSSASLASRPSMDSVARSVSTDHTVTPATLRLSRQLSGRASPAFSCATASTSNTSNSTAAHNTDRLHLGAPRSLRNFMSLQDLRQTVRPSFAPPTRAQQQLFESHHDGGGLTRSSSSQNSLAANLGHPSHQQLPTPLSAASSRQTSSTPTRAARSSSSSSSASSSSSSSSGGASRRRSVVGGAAAVVGQGRHRHTGSGSSTKSCNSLGYSHSSASSSETGFDLSLGNSSYTSGMTTATMPDSLVLDDSGPASPASMAQPHTPPSPHWLDPASRPNTKGAVATPDWLLARQEVYTNTMVPLPANFTFGEEDQPHHCSSSSSSRKRAVSRGATTNKPPSASRSGSRPAVTPNGSFVSLASCMQPSPSSSGAPTAGSSVIIKAKHGDEIVMAKVARGCTLRDVKAAIIDRFSSHKVQLDDSIQLTQACKPPGGGNSSSSESAADMPLRTEEDWQLASASGPKITLLC